MHYVFANCQWLDTLSRYSASMFDGHVELVKLDDLWQLYWHRGYQPPAQRPN